jgi:hypothetical protein
MVFGHRKCFRGYRVLIGSPEGVPGTPGKKYGPYGPRGETHQPQGAGAPPIWAGLRRRRKGGRERKVWINIPTSFPLPPPSFLPPWEYMAGGGGQGRSPRAGRPPMWCARLPSHPNPQYIFGRGRRAHPRQLPSRVRRPPSTVYTPDHIFVVLRRSPEKITSPSPSPRHRADGTHLLN